MQRGPPGLEANTKENSPEGWRGMGPDNTGKPLGPAKLEAILLLDITVT